jgi:hypothetical protein
MNCVVHHGFKSVETSRRQKEIKKARGQNGREPTKEQGYKGKKHRISTISLKNG